MGVGDAELADDDLGIDARRVDIAEDVGHASDRAARRRRPSRQFDRHHFARRGAALLTGRHKDVHQDAAIERDDETHTVLVAVVSADQPTVAPLENADDASFEAATFLDSLDAGDHPIAMHRFAEMWGGDVNVAASVERPLGYHEPIAGRVRFERSDIQVHFFRKAEPLAANLDEVAGADQRLEVAPERHTLLTRDLEQLLQFARTGGVMYAFAHLSEDLFTRQHC